MRVLIQLYAKGPGEAGLFYLRLPSTDHGRILSLTIKHFPEVIGDGTSTLRELILRDGRARAFTELYFKRNRKTLDRVVLPGERHRIVSVGNHVRGAAFEDGSAHITPALEQAFDTIAQEVPGFFVGRFDVRYESLEALMRGEGFTIVAYNGAGGEPTHIWDPQKRHRDLWRAACAFEVPLRRWRRESRARCSADGFSRPGETLLEGAASAQVLSRRGIVLG